MPVPPLPVAVAAAIILDGNRVLVTRRPAGAHLEGLWEFPGGKIEPPETPEECACREVWEETGLQVQVVNRLPEVVHAYPERTVHLHFCLCTVVGGSLNPTLQEARWMALSDLATLPMPAANLEVVADQLIADGRGVVQ